jgi:outer membrane protein TolC
MQEAEIDQSGARVFSPSLSVTANTNLPGLDYSVGAQFAFSISDFDFKARDDAQKNLSSAVISYENALSMALFDVRQAILELEFSLEELEAARDALAAAQLGLAETQYFAEQREATELELAQSELAVLTAEYAVVGAEVEVASSWFSVQFAQF